MSRRRGDDDEPLDIDSTLAGRAYQSGAPTGTDGGGDMWFPVRDGADRLGALRLRFASHDDGVETSARHLASLAADLVVAKSRYSDLFEQIRRRRPLGLAAELQRQLLPPLTFRTPRVDVAGVLEPAYEVAGDSFDYALNNDILSAAVFDGVGHDLASGVMTTLAVGAYRNARRNEFDLAETATAIDEALRSQFHDKAFVTAALIKLHVSTGALRWLNAGHPRPLLLRGGRVVRTLSCSPRPPLGLPHTDPEIATDNWSPAMRCCCSPTASSKPARHRERRSASIASPTSSSEQRRPAWNLPKPCAGSCTMWSTTTAASSEMTPPASSSDGPHAEEQRASAAHTRSTRCPTTASSTSRSRPIGPSTETGYRRRWRGWRRHRSGLRGRTRRGCPRS